MGCAISSRLDSLSEDSEAIHAKLEAIEARLAEPSEGLALNKQQSAARELREDGKYDIFVSHAKKLLESEDRAVWVSDVAEASGLRPFFDRSDLIEITEPALKDALLASDVCVTVLDPFTFNSTWVFKENLFAANVGIPIVAVYDADRFRWEGQLDKWLRLYPFVFSRQVIPLSKSQRRASVKSLLEAIGAAAAEGRKPPAQRIEASHNARAYAKVGVGGSRETETRSAIDTAHKGMLARLDGHTPSLVVAAFTCTHNASEVANRLHELAPGIPMIGCTSCRGVVLNDTWLTHKKETALGLWGICDDAGSYVTLHLTTRPPSLRDAVLAEVAQAIKLRHDEPPSFAVLLGSPGDEEIILDGMQAALGDKVPILGGSSGDNTVSGEWQQICKVGSSNFKVAPPNVSASGITIAIGWASCCVATTLTSGFRKTNKQGTVTKVDTSDHGRTILEIDGRKVKDIYEKWSAGEVTRAVEWKNNVATVLASSSFCPLGEVCDGGYVRVMHPAFLNKSSGALTTFADARVGMPIAMLDAAPETLAKKISHSARELLVGQQLHSGSSTAADAFEVEDVVGALNIFCGGLVMAIDDMMPMAAEQLSEVVGHNNTMGICCFGEQGMDASCRAIHGNLMFGCLLFSNKMRTQKSVEAELAEMAHAPTEDKLNA
mmetsp:Transcript_65103/g.108157  ORF Transcript_65103/g.108157 Transcript_65103/m.108157 type:complete len:662 (+) Transcript_65103:39-2024(+)|eukprot:CAMPEP_0119303586 /NCGR_PEP_ID=MMETSP1333-20130426/5006_1 /TAXON_ID=418940 /ORGANISM="Scyphosphaera apsteinii, Strain RCC1455" /LENGTH=661 /DNA_ID=CAMNT_0007306305 /DNA_START=33 /DNA_END=2018 /DNA_ORIENTATION=-